MRIRTLTVFFWLILIGASVASEKHETHMEISAENKVPDTLFAQRPSDQTDHSCWK